MAGEEECIRLKEYFEGRLAEADKRLDLALKAQKSDLTGEFVTRDYLEVRLRASGLLTGAAAFIAFLVGGIALVVAFLRMTK